MPAVSATILDPKKNASTRSIHSIENRNIGRKAVSTIHHPEILRVITASSISLRYFSTNKSSLHSPVPRASVQCFKQSVPFRTAHKRPTLQWVPRFKRAQNKSVWDLRAVKWACSAYTISHVFPTTDKSNV